MSIWIPYADPSLPDRLIAKVAKAFGEDGLLYARDNRVFFDPPQGVSDEQAIAAMRSLGMLECRLAGEAFPPGRPEVPPAAPDAP